MERYAGLPIAAALVAFSAVMIWWHRASWAQVANDDAIDEHDRDYRRRQHRRRMQTSAMLGFLGLAVGVGPWIREPLLVVTFWAAVLLLVMWIVLLAVADIVSTRLYFRRLRDNYLIEKTKLRAELRRAQDARRNGQ